MKLSSPRTWLVIAAAGLLLVGAVVMLVVKLAAPPIPQGWTVEYQPDYEIAWPPGRQLVPAPLPWGARRVTTVEVGPGVIVEFEDNPESFAGADPERVADLVVVQLRAAGTNIERTKVQGHPAVSVLSSKAGKTMKTMTVFTGYSMFELRADIVPGVFSEKDADVFFRLFRIKTHP